MSDMTWYANPTWAGRLAAETHIMAQRFPRFRLRTLPDGQVAWVGELEPVRGKSFTVRIEYPVRYPYEVPKIWIDSPPIPANAPHRFTDGTLCIYRRRWNPESSTPASLIPLTCAWLVRFLAWQEDGRTW